MTHQIIKTDNYLLVVDEDSTKAHLPLNGAPVLEGVDLLPPFSRHQENDVEDAVMEFKELYGSLGVTDYELSAFSKGYKKAREKYKFTEEHVFGFLTYYNSINFNKSEYRYKHPTMDGSEREYNRSIDRKILAEYIQSLQQPKIPITFECEMEEKNNYHDSDEYEYEEEYVPKTTTINGRRVWVGKYIY